jgi:hypothetical protein
VTRKEKSMLGVTPNWRYRESDWPQASEIIAGTITGMCMAFPSISAVFQPLIEGYLKAQDVMVNNNEVLNF